ncbi:IS66 family transposase [Maridesulfovibrio bastinii]|uniref:IS66 family transposase n=1 Tax=Maridesulfovibrio bastinii TaxID=47157 RepID=UPI0024817F28|nr:transposase [Maridesulfovibrio bastinii]
MDISRSTISNWAVLAAERCKPIMELLHEHLRSGKIAAEIVGDFMGILQTDGYAGYNALGESTGITHAGCLVHVRRKFMEELKACSKKRYVSTVVDLIAKLYRLESRARKERLSPDEILNMRTEKALPILEKIY